MGAFWGVHRDGSLNSVFVSSKFRARRGVRPGEPMTKAEQTRLTTSRFRMLQRASEATGDRIRLADADLVILVEHDDRGR